MSVGWGLLLRTERGTGGGRWGRENIYTLTWRLLSHGDDLSERRVSASTGEPFQFQTAVR